MSQRVDLANGSYVEVLGECCDTIQDWIGLIKDNMITVAEIRFPFVPKRAKIPADQVIEKSNGWEIGSQLLLADGRQFTVLQTPKISLSWLKQTNNGYVLKLYKPKVELAAISRNVLLNHNPTATIADPAPIQHRWPVEKGKIVEILGMRVLNLFAPVYFYGCIGDQALLSVEQQGSNVNGLPRFDLVQGRKILTHQYVLMDFGHIFGSLKGSTRSYSFPEWPQNSPNVPIAVLLDSGNYQDINGNPIERKDLRKFRIQ